MAKDDNSHKLSADEKVLGRVESSLRKLAMEGEIDLPVTDDILKRYEKELSPEAGERMWTRIRQRSAVADRFRVCPGRSEADKLPFHELIRTLRTKAGIPLEETAWAMRLTSSDVAALEEGKKNPLEIPADILATLMEVYWLSLSLVSQSLKRLLAVQAVRQKLSGVSARSTGEVADEEYERAFQDVASHIAQTRNTADKVELPAVYMETLRSTLQRRGRSDLL